MTEQPIFLEFLLTFVEKLLEFNVVFMVFDVKSKSHRWVDFCEMNLFCVTFVIIKMVLGNLILFTWYRIFCVMRIQEDKALFLHAQQIVGFTRPSTNNSNIQMAPEKLSHCLEKFRRYLFKAKSYRNQNQHTIAPVLDQKISTLGAILILACFGCCIISLSFQALIEEIFKIILLKEYLRSRFRLILRIKHKFLSRVIAIESLGSPKLLEYILAKKNIQL